MLRWVHLVVLVMLVGLSGCRGVFVVSEDTPLASTSSTTASATTHGSSTAPSESTAAPGESAATGDSLDEASSSSSDGTQSTSTTEPPTRCDAPSGHTVCDGTGNDPFHAIGLSCPGGDENRTAITNQVLQSNDPAAWRIAREYGSDRFVPQEGERLLLLTTGRLPEPDETWRIEVPLDQVNADNGDNSNAEGQTLPTPVQTQSGARDEPFVDCDGVGDCSETLDTFETANDLVYLRFDVEVPRGTFGYQVDLAWFSAEYPHRVASARNDMFVWWQSSDAFTGNAATLEGEPLTARGLRPYIGTDPTLTGNASKLVGTGFEGTVSAECSYAWGSYENCPNGATTDWLTLDAPVQPGEIVTIVIALFDQVDRELDTTIVVDNFRWTCDGCEPGSTCGLHPLGG